MRKLRDVVLGKCLESITKHAITKFVPYEAADNKKSDYGTPYNKTPDYKTRKTPFYNCALSGFAWEWIPIWGRAGLVDLPVFATILVQLFFPRWCEFLIGWMQTGGDLDEIGKEHKEIRRI